MKKILDVPYLSQFDNVSDTDWQGRACGIACLAMVLAYYERETRSLSNLISIGLEVDAHSSEAGGWYDSGLCRVANKLGYVAWRRRWALSRSDKEVFEKEGRTDTDNEAYEEQFLKEGLYSIENSLLLNIPVIVPVNKNFDPDGFGHLIVLTGYEKDGEKLMGFYYNDPNSKGAVKKDEYAHLQKFLEHWKRRGIYVKKA